MSHKSTWFDQTVVEILQSGGIGCGPTDTVYGVLARADSAPAIERIYRLKQRNEDKSLIVLVSEIAQLATLGIKAAATEQLSNYWPGPTTVVVEADNTYEHLRRGKTNLALRMPANRALRRMISKVGPVVAPSANREGDPPATTLKQAYDYFGLDMDFYVGSNRSATNRTSTIILLENGTVKQLR